ncbi:MAG: alpha/beta fold hydrolase [Actinomycetota bacterium]
MRPCQPDEQGVITRDGVRVAYDVYGQGNSPTILLLPSWSIVAAGHWKFQVPVLARHHRVITIDGRGNGRSDRPADPAAYTVREYVADAVAVLDATGTGRAVVAGMSLGAPRAIELAGQHPDRVLGVVLIDPAVDWVGTGPDPRAEYTGPSFTEEPTGRDGWDLFNAHVFRRDYARFVDFFWRSVFPEPYSCKAIEDGTGWAAQTTPEVLISAILAPEWKATRGDLATAVQAVRCPLLTIHGTEDGVVPAERSVQIADLTGADVLMIEGGGHCPHVRDPVVVNRALREFIGRVTPPGERTERRATWTRALRRPRKVLYLSSPIGLGHARRDVAIAAELRKLREDVQIDWLAQHPVTAVLDGSGERVHPASAYLASESSHVESEAGDHDLHAFQAIRRMDEVLLANFSVTQDVIEDGTYDLVVGDEAWDLDRFWHENPELKRSAYAWMTDFVGWLPVPSGGDHEAALTAELNKEMLEHMARFGRVRDRSIFIGDPDDIVPHTFGPGLPSIREWTEQHYDFAGYVTGFHPDFLPMPRESGPPEVIVAVGGSAVGEGLLRKVAEALPIARKELPDLTMTIVTGPRIDPARLAAELPASLLSDGLEIRGYVPDLHRQLSTASLAIVQGGLTTTMELVAGRRPFLYFPLANHFEQQIHVRHRLERYGAGRRMDYAATDPGQLAEAMIAEITSPADYLPVSPDGAARAAKMIADLL